MHPSGSSSKASQGQALSQLLSHSSQHTGNICLTLSYTECGEIETVLLASVWKPHAASILLLLSYVGPGVSSKAPYLPRHSDPSNSSGASSELPTLPCNLALGGWHRAFSLEVSTTELSYLTSDTPFHPPTPLGWVNLLRQITVSHIPFALCLDLSFLISKAKNLELLFSQHFLEATGDAQDLGEWEAAMGKKERLGREHSVNFSHYIT